VNTFKSRLVCIRDNQMCFSWTSLLTPRLASDVEHGMSSRFQGLCVGWFPVLQLGKVRDRTWVRLGSAWDLTRERINWKPWQYFVQYLTILRMYMSSCVCGHHFKPPILVSECVMVCVGVSAKCSHLWCYLWPYDFTYLIFTELLTSFVISFCHNHMQ